MARIAIAGAGLAGRLFAWTLARAGHAVEVHDPAPGPAPLFDGGGAAAQKRVEDQVAFAGGGEQTALDQRNRLLRGVFAKGFFLAPRRGQRPDGRCGVR